MTSEQQSKQGSSGARILARLRDRLWTAASRILLRTAPLYARHRAGQAEMAGALARLQAEFEHVRERHDEQIERLEEMARELVLAVESLRREISKREQRD
ncbi:MAG TPA: hypothetical protein VN892_11440 [Solirubrobacteraceae bacterium]|nr:hypothetical protein [Solirubrobacteraceae bacterium]